MQTDDAEVYNKYCTYLDEIFSKMVKSFNTIQLEDYTTKTLTKSNDLIKNGSLIVRSISNHLNCMKNLLADCSSFIDEMTSEMTIDDTDNRTDGLYVYLTKNGMLGYPGKEFIINAVSVAAESTDNKKETAAPVASSIPSEKNTSVTDVINSRDIPYFPEEKIFIPEIKYNLKIAKVKELNEIPAAMYYYDGAPDKTGVYMRLPSGNIVKIPFPEIIDSKELNRAHSIRCKYITNAECDNQRTRMSRMHNSTIRICNFAHKGDRIIKIGYPSRCPSVPNFGNPATMENTIYQISENDAKNLLLYGTSDLFAAIVWLDYSNYENVTFDSLDVC